MKRVTVLGALEVVGVVETLAGLEQNVDPHVIRGLALQIQSLRHDRDSLLSKFLFPEDEEEAQRHQRRVLDNANESRENLHEHKHLLKMMMGRANMLHDDNVRLKTELDSLRSDVNAFLYDFESMRGSASLKERLLAIDPQPILQTHLLDDKTEK